MSGATVRTATYFAVKERQRMEVPYIQTTEDTVKFATLCETKLDEDIKGFMEKKTYATYRKLQEAELTRITQSPIENVEVICWRPPLRIMKELRTWPLAPIMNFSRA